MTIIGSFMMQNTRVDITLPLNTGRYTKFGRIWFRFMVFNTTFNNISEISWQSVLLVEETCKPGK
jgi:hypothetical protein